MIAKGWGENYKIETHMIQGNYKVIMTATKCTRCKTAHRSIFASGKRNPKVTKRAEGLRQGIGQRIPANVCTLVVSLFLAAGKEWAG